MHVIYSPQGRAKEYCELACNIYLRCMHKCVYCYSPQTLHISKEDFFVTPAPRPRFLESLKRDAEVLKITGHHKVLLSFIGDCYQPINDQFQLARQAIEVLHFYGQSVAILTKGGYRALPDMSLLKAGDEFAVTLTCVDEAQSKEWEPGAAMPSERIESLKEAYARGIYTWVSLEPVLYPEQSLELIRMTHEFVNKYKLGILNYHPRSKEIDWANYGHRAVNLLEKLHKEYFVKLDLKKWLAVAIGVFPRPPFDVAQAERDIKELF